MYEVAGVVGVDPEPFTLRELWWMYRGADKMRWRHTSMICATLVNVHRTKKQRAMNPDAFDPYARKGRGRRRHDMTFKQFLGFCRPERTH